MRCNWKGVAPAAALLIANVAAHGQFTQMIAYTSTNPYERFPVGRPKVPEDLLAKVKELVIEEAYGAVRGGNFPNQFGVPAERTEEHTGSHRPFDAL
jgi:hypothetical protein